MLKFLKSFFTATPKQEPQPEAKIEVAPPTLQELAPVPPAKKPRAAKKPKAATAATPTITVAPKAKKAAPAKKTAKK